MRSLGILLLATLAAAACGGNDITAPSTAAVTLTLSPNPVAIPAAGQRLTWDVTLAENAGVGVRIDRDEMKAVDSAGGTVAEQKGVYPSGQARLEAHKTATWHGMNAAFLGAPRAATLSYAVYYTDDQGHSGVATASVPIM